MRSIRWLFFLRDENGEVLGGLLGDIWAAWLHVRTLAVAAPVRGPGFAKELMKRAETYASERGWLRAWAHLSALVCDRASVGSRLLALMPYPILIGWLFTDVSGTLSE
jgi:GNAT superfamily N-acetyltransferase